MKPIFIIFLLSTFFSDLAYSENRNLLKNDQHQECKPYSDLTLYSGFTNAVKILDDEDFLRNAKIEYLHSVDYDESCSFWFELSSQSNGSILAEVTLSKLKWKVLKRTLFDGPNSLAW